jgi:hypothetical protein
MKQLFEKILQESKYFPEDKKALDSIGQELILKNMEDVANEGFSIAKYSKKMGSRIVRLIEIAYRNGYQTKSNEVFEKTIQKIKNAAVS